MPGPDGILGNADDVTIPINPNSIKFTLLDTVTGGKGREMIQFSTQGTLTNNLYQVTLLSTGPDAVRDIAGNVATPAASEQFVVDVPAAGREPIRRRPVIRHQPDGGDRHQGEPVPDDRRGHDGGCPPATSWRFCPASIPNRSR